MMNDTSVERVTRSGHIPNRYLVCEKESRILRSVKDLKLIDFRKVGGEAPIHGNVMRQRAIDLMANLGISDLGFVLDNQSEIPVEFRKYNIVFPRTIVGESYPHFPYIYWYEEGKCWCMQVCSVDASWEGEHNRLACY